MNYFIAYKTILRHEMIKFFSVWTQSIIGPAVTMTLYFVIFGKLLGQHITPFQGVAYIDFITPGIIMMTVISGTYMYVSASVFLAKFQRVITTVLAAPVPNWIVLAGYTSGGVFRGLFLALTVGVIASLFTSLKIAHPLLALVTVVFASAIFAQVGILNAIFANNFEHISYIPTFVITPLTYLGGVFFPLSLLPPVWQNIAALNPVYYIIQSFRYGLLGLGGEQSLWALLVTAVMAGLIFMVNLCLLRSGVGLKS